MIEYAFLWAFLAGGVPIVAIKLFAPGDPIVAGLAAAGIGILVMVLFMAHQRRTRFEDESPRLGDEVYYLGLLYTLTSLCGALVILFLLDDWSPSPRGEGAQTLEQRTDAMIGSFGIALLTTIAGIVIRVMLQRYATEPDATVIRIPHTRASVGRRGVTRRWKSGGASGNGGLERDQEREFDDGYGSEERYRGRFQRRHRVESTAVDLDRFAFELRTQLQNTMNAFTSHTNQAIVQARMVHAHMDEMMNTFHRGLEEKAKAELEAVAALYKDIASRAEDVMKRTETQQTGVQSVLSRLETQTRRLDESIERTRVECVESAENLSAVSAQAKASMQALAESGSTVTEGLSQLIQAIDVEKEYREARARFATKMDDNLEQQAEVWSGVQRRASEAMEQLERTSQALAGLVGVVQRTSTELMVLPDGLHKAGDALDRLTEITSTGSELENLKNQVRAVTEGLVDFAGAGKRQREAVEATVHSLQALADIAGPDADAQARLRESVAQIAEAAVTVGRYAESIKDAEREIRQVDTGLKSVRNATENKGSKLAENLKQDVDAFGEIRREDGSAKTWFGRIFRR